MTLSEYVVAHTERSACRCGQCTDRAEGPDPKPSKHTADLTFFQVSAVNDPDRVTFEALVRQHRGEFAEVDVFDGREHSFIELGAWLGDQGLALQFMGLGAVLGSFDLKSPNTVVPRLSEETRQRMAMLGYVTVQSLKGGAGEQGDRVTEARSA